MAVESIWPRNKTHYLCCDEARYIPYISNALQMIRWAFANGLIDDDRGAITQQWKSRITDQSTVLMVVTKLRRSTLMDIAGHMESDPACIGRALCQLHQKALISRFKIPVMVNGKVRGRWCYEPKK